MRAILFAALTATTALYLAACGTASTTADEPQKPAPVTERGSDSRGATPREVPPTPAPSANPLKDPGNILSKRSIYFDFDKFEVRDEFRPLVEAHAKYLRENPGTKVLIQGNADERGSREYNVGLGQRRSETVKRMMTLLGARESQIESVSLGEEKPVCPEHNEDCWAKNRRDDILYGGEY